LFTESLLTLTHKIFTLKLLQNDTSEDWARKREIKPQIMN